MAKHVPPGSQALRTLEPSQIIKKPFLSIHNVFCKAALMSGRHARAQLLLENCLTTCSVSRAGEPIKLFGTF